MPEIINQGSPSIKGFPTTTLNLTSFDSLAEITDPTIPVGSLIHAYSAADNITKTFVVSHNPAGFSDGTVTFSNNDTLGFVEVVGAVEDAKLVPSYASPLFVPRSTISRGLPLPMDEPLVISTDSGANDYNSWPSASYWDKTDEVLAVWRRGNSHGGTLTGEIMLSKTTDGTKARAWTTPVIIIANDGGDFRDPLVHCLSDRVLVFATHFASWGTDEDGRVFVYESFDRTNFTKVGEIKSTSDVIGNFEGFNRAVVNGELIIGPNGEYIIGGWETNLRQNSSQSFYRSCCWRSLDSGRTWSQKGIVLPALFNDPDDRESFTQSPNETCLIVLEGNLVAFVRDNPNSGTGESQKLGEHL